MSQTTPGPWRYGRTLTHGLAVWGSLRVGEPEHVVAVTYENTANARLIAAAPDLLEFIKDLVQGAESDAPQPDDLLNKAKALIAKAEGRS